MRKLILLGLLWPALSFPDQTGPMEEIVVTATRSEKLLLVNPYSVDVVTEEDILFSSHDQLAEIVSKVPGILISDAGQAGQKRIRIRGEEARRVALLIDGQEFVDHREVGVPLLVDINGVQRVEVVKSPASVLYGPRAMGGVINVITRKDSNEPLEVSFNSTYNGATDGYNAGIQLSGRLENGIGWAVGRARNHQGERDTPEGEMERTAYDSESYNGYLSYATDQHTAGLGFESFESDSEVFVEEHVRFTPPFRDFILDAPQRDRQKLRIDYQYAPLGTYLQTIRVDGYQQLSEREFNSFPLMTLAPGLNVDTSIFTTSELDTNGLNLQSDWEFNDRISMIAGVQWVKDDIEQSRLRIVETNGFETSNEEQLDEADLETLAGYAQFEIELADNITLTPGVRTYRVDGELSFSNHFSELSDFDDNHTVTSAALVYTPSESSTYRVSYSEGYIHPSLFNLVIGAFAGSSFINPVPTLDPETSETFELGYRYAGSSWSLDTVAFHTRAKDYIDHLPCVVADACPGSRDRIYKNIGEANTHGVELALNFQYNQYALDAGVTWLQREKIYESVDTWDSGVPQLAGFISGSYTTNLWQKPLVTELSVRFESDTQELVATRRGSTLEENAGFEVVDVELHYQPSESTSISFVAANLGDKKYHSATENLWAPGRHLRIKLGVSL